MIKVCEHHKQTHITQSSHLKNCDRMIGPASTNAPLEGNLNVRWGRVEREQIDRCLSNLLKLFYCTWLDAVDVI